MSRSAEYKQSEFVSIAIGSVKSAVRHMVSKTANLREWNTLTWTQKLNYCNASVATSEFLGDTQH